MTQLTIADYEEVLADHRRLVRELDVALNGEEGAAKQASLGDIVRQVRRDKREDHGETVLRIQGALGITTTGWISPDVILLRINQLKKAAGNE